MSDISVEQATADALIGTPKIRANNAISYYPGAGGHPTLPLLTQRVSDTLLPKLISGEIRAPDAMLEVAEA